MKIEKLNLPTTPYSREGINKLLRKEKNTESSQAIDPESGSQNKNKEGSGDKRNPNHFQNNVESEVPAAVEESNTGALNIIV